MKKKVAPAVALATALFLAWLPCPLCTCARAAGSAAKAENQKKIENLQKRKRQLDEDVRSIDSKITQTRKSARDGLVQIEQLNENIRQRNELIEAQNQQIVSQQEYIDKLNEEISATEVDYSASKKKYVELLYNAYQKNSVFDRMLYLFSARSLKESYSRFLYIKEFARSRRRQASDIKETHTDLLQMRADLQQAKRESERLLADREAEKNNLEKEKAQQKTLVASLQKEEKELRSQLQKQQQTAEKLNNSIESLIAEEARRAAREAAAEKKKNTAKKPATPAKETKPQTPNKQNGTAPAKKPEPAKLQPAKPAGNLGQEFAAQKGRMHWPVRIGSITGHYGRQPHPVLKNVTENNKGVYISSPAGMDALAVATGKVTQKFSIPGNNTAVIVRHGNYLTVYANLTSVYVSIGQTVVQGDKIGRIYTDPSGTGRAQLYFQVWNEKNIQNPEQWLRPLR